MIIKNIHDLAAHFCTTSSGLKKTLCDRTHCELYIAEAPTSIRIGAEIPECNVEFCTILRYPFESQPVDVFIDTVGHNVSEAYFDVFDDPVDMIINMTNPGEEWTIEDAGHILGEAIAQGWHFTSDVDPQMILDIYNDMKTIEEDE